MILTQSIQLPIHSRLKTSNTMPHATKREPPIIKPATNKPSDPGHGAAFIFLHGLGDDAEGCESRPTAEDARKT